jgi:hypothetical protein
MSLRPQLRTVSTRPAIGDSTGFPAGQSEILRHSAPCGKMLQNKKVMIIINVVNNRAGV